jgi:hypothetical protein
MEGYAHACAASGSQGNFTGLCDNEQFCLWCHDGGFPIPFAGPIYSKYDLVRVGFGAKDGSEDAFWLFRLLSHIKS